MENKIFEELVKIRYSEMDFNLILKPSVLLNFLQDLASDNAETLGFGYSYIIKHNLAWFLLKYHMEFEDYPENICDLKIITEPRGYNKHFAFRDFKVFNNEKLIGRVASMWSLVDITNKSMTSIANIFSENKYMKCFEKREDDLTYEKIRPMEHIDIEKIFEVRFDDIDVNKHVNNANYIIWAFEALNLDFRTSRKLKTLDMIFKKEITFGNKILSQVEIIENTTNHILKNLETGEDLCIISAKWTNK